MNPSYRPLDLAGVSARPISDRAHRVHVADFAPPPAPGASFAEFVDALPHLLKGSDFRAVVDDLARAVRAGTPVILGLGAHVIKCGLSPIVIDLIRRGYVSAVALNGGGAIHDFEIALFGATSEDVEAHLRDGRYGMVAETACAMQQAIDGTNLQPGTPPWGLGWELGRWLVRAAAPHAHVSILYQAFQAGVPVTVHTAIGTDTLHMHPVIDVARLAALSHRDFRLLAAVVAELVGGGAYVNVGSAVVLPEVFLKCVTLCRNLGYDIRGFTTVDLDMVRHYRPMTNVVHRPQVLDVRGYSLTGHHEIMVPLLAYALVERLDGALGQGAPRRAGGGTSHDERAGR